MFRTPLDCPSLPPRSHCRGRNGTPPCPRQLLMNLEESALGPNAAWGFIFKDKLFPKALHIYLYNCTEIKFITFDLQDPPAAPEGATRLRGIICNPCPVYHVSCVLSSQSQDSQFRSQDIWKWIQVSWNCCYCPGTTQIPSTWRVFRIWGGPESP